MRKFLFVLIAVMAILGIQTTAKASFTSLGWVDPNYNNSWNPATLSGTARYYFYWDYPTVTVNQLDLEFEGDIFDFSVLDGSDFNVIMPPTWTTTMWQEDPGVYHWSFSSGTGIDSTQDPIILDVNYTLLSESRYYYGNNVAAGEAGEWSWLEAQGANTPWSQKYELRQIVNIPGYGNFTVDSSGGSTAPIPEPASMMLLGVGVGILGLIGLKRKA